MSCHELSRVELSLVFCSVLSCLKVLIGVKRVVVCVVVVVIVVVVVVERSMLCRVREACK